MMNKLIALVLILTFAASALADDLVPAPWANDGENNRIPGTPGSTFSQWEFTNAISPNPNWETVYFPDNFFFVHHDEKEDPAPFDHEMNDPCDPAFSAFVEGFNADPCAPFWYDTFGPAPNRQGFINMGGASFYTNNFIHEQPAKDIWLQLTYFNGDPCNPTEFARTYSGGLGIGPPTGEYACPLAEWPDPCMPITYTWVDIYADPCLPEVVLARCTMELTEWDPSWPEPMDTWDEVWQEGGPFVKQSSQKTADGLWHDVFKVELPMNPFFEEIYITYGEHWEVGPGIGVMMDQIIIETICYVPEPATMALLGLGSLLMIRRKK